MPTDTEVIAALTRENARKDARIHELEKAVTYTRRRQGQYRAAFRSVGWVLTDAGRIALAAANREAQ